MRGIERHQRGEAVAPLGNRSQRLGVGGFIGIEYLQLRTDGAGVGKRQARLKAETGGRVIKSKNLQRVVLFGNDDAGMIASVLPGRAFLARTGTRFARKRFSRCGVAAAKLAFDTVDGQARQPQAEDTPPVSRKGTHHISIP